MSTPVTRAMLWLILLSAIGLSHLACEEAATGPSSVPPSAISIETVPESIRFDPLTGNRDTTLAVQLTLTVSSASDVAAAGFSVREFGDVLMIGDLELSETRDDGTSIYTGVFELDTQTSRSRLIDIHTFAFDTQGRGEVLTRRLVQTGFATLPPSILSIDHPAEVVLPTSGSKSIRFEVTAVHPVDQDLMDGVFLFLVDSQSNRIPADGSTFRLYDDGFSQLSAGRDDRIASDSVYTIVLSVSSSNQPDSYTLHWFPRDLSGLVGDTLTSSLRFTSPP